MKMIVKSIDYANNIFITEDGSEYPIIFDINFQLQLKIFRN